MATKREKQELLDTLKFTPTPVRIQLYGYGGECYIGSVSREQYEFFRSKKIDIDQYTHSWDENGMWDDVPADMRPFDPGSPYECDDLFHGSGATMDESSWILVEEVATGRELFKANLDISNLETLGVTVDLVDDCDSGDWPDGKIVFWGGQGEKGCFFDGEVTLRAPFDPSKLRISYGNGDDWYISSGVEYDGEDVEGTDDIQPRASGPKASSGSRAAKRCMKAWNATKTVTATMTLMCLCWMGKRCRPKRPLTQSPTCGKVFRCRPGGQ